MIQTAFERRGWRTLRESFEFSRLTITSLLMLIAFVRGGVAYGESLNKVFDSLEQQFAVGSDADSALNELRAQARKTTRALDPEILPNFESSIVNRIAEIQKSVGNSLSPKYAKAAFALRLLELAEAVVAARHRVLDAGQFHEARAQVQAVLERLERDAAAKNPPLDSTVKDVVIEAVRMAISDVQQDFFNPAFGRPLSAGVNEELSKAVTEMLDQAGKLSMKLDQQKASGTTRLQEGSMLAVDEQVKISLILAKVSQFSNDNNELADWRKSVAALRKSINQGMIEASRQEQQSFSSWAAEDARRTQERLDLKAVEERNRQQNPLVADHEHNHQVASAFSGSRLIGLNVLVILGLASFLIWRTRR